MQLNIQFINAFTDTLFKGNSAAVVLLEQWLSDELMQSIATENMLSETAFLVKLPDGRFHIRWFSPITEIDFCGHASLASAYALFTDNSRLNSLIFHADAVGDFTVEKDVEFITMNFPLMTPEAVDEIPLPIISGLSIKPILVLKNKQAYFAVYENESDVINVVQNSDQIKLLAPLDVVVTAPSKDYDFVCRYFWPANGGDEDPVTGSIYAGLAPYWHSRLRVTCLEARQASLRGGLVKCKLLNNRVLVSGKAVKYLTGTIDV
ncbi:PhzF family phenazine biosynthesis isomerase [Thalassotalea nanhaiensis]|uniref:PhzF family phenazine biosynthesis isomerase n=1 Tax=Thalassotalea nanhaiensis TaxID=3065648 RepID=A0ABY9TN33_9GAMM|nr:PhzF family phenazine biosynthesis isomerase [Colwelliaceae bacterium SQ345]